MPKIVDYEKIVDEIKEAFGSKNIDIKKVEEKLSSTHARTLRMRADKVKRGLYTFPAKTIVFNFDEDDINDIVDSKVTAPKPVVSPPPAAPETRKVESKPLKIPPRPKPTGKPKPTLSLDNENVNGLMAKYFRSEFENIDDLRACFELAQIPTIDVWDDCIVNGNGVFYLVDGMVFKNDRLLGPIELREEMGLISYRWARGTPIIESFGKTTRW